MREFDPNMTYWQSLRIVARGMVRFPLDSGEWSFGLSDFTEGLQRLWWASQTLILVPAMRLAAMLLLPISAPLFAWLVQVERRKTAAAREDAQRRANEHWGKLVKKQEPTA